MPERQLELRRRYHRKKKMAKLKAKLLAGTLAGPDREKVIYKIKRLSPWWTEASMTQGHKQVATAAPTPERERKAAPKAKGPPRAKAEKK